MIIDPEVKLEQALGGKVESIQEEECDECGSEEHTTEEHELSVKEEILLDRAVVALSELEEMIGIDEAERSLGDRLHRKRKLYDRTVPKAMDYARREGEAAGHARYRMGQLSREMDKVKDKMKEKEKK